MLLHIRGSNQYNRKLVSRATWWYVEKLMGKRLMSGLEIHIHLRKNLIDKEGCEGTAIWEGDYCDRPREFKIELDVSYSIRDALITLAHEMVHIKQWAKDEMYEYMNVAGMVRFKGEKVHMEITDYWDYPWEIEAYGRQLGLFIRFCENTRRSKYDDMKEEA